MSFFNTKEEVIDIKLTQFGKDLLTRGFFKPVYYQLFDDDILYESNFGGFQEHQNNSEKRILEETPRLKTQYLTYGVENAYIYEDSLIDSGEREIFSPLRRNVDPAIQDRILLYPLYEYEINSEQAPKIELRAHDQVFKDTVSFLQLTGSGINKKIPQLSIEPEYTIREDRSDIRDPKMLNQETFVDLMSREVVFADNSKIIVSSKDILIDMEELNVFYGLDNFEVEIYESVEVDNRDNALRRIRDLDEINEYFHIKTDEDVEEITIPSGRSRNYYRRGES